MKYFFPFFFILSVFFDSSSHAKVYVLPDPLNIKIFFVENGHDDFLLKLEAIERSTATVDVFTHLQSYDDAVGKPLISALNDAIKRGVRVRFAAEQMPSLFENKLKGNAPFDLLTKTIASIPDCNSRAYHLTVSDKRRSGFSIFDFFHHKMELINAGRSDEIAFISGRNNSGLSVRDADFTVVITRNDPNKPSAVSTILEHFEDSWHEASLMKGLGSEELRVPRWAPPSTKSFETQALLDGASNELQYLKNILFESRPDTKRRFLIPTQMNLTSNSLFEQLRAQQQSPEGIQRDLLQSDNEQFIAETIRSAKKSRISLMNADFTPQIEKAITEALVDHGAEIELFLNSEESDRVAHTFGKQFLLSARALERLENAVNANPLAKLKIYFLDPSKAATAKGHLGQIKYNHGKVMIADGKVIISSDNLNRGSAEHNSETAVSFEGEAVSQYVENHFNRLETIFRAPECNEILDASARSQHPINRMLIKTLSLFF